MAISLLGLLAVTVGLIDGGRGIFAYNAVSAIARYGSRWGSVVGGSCGYLHVGTSTSDWCNQIGGSASGFWEQAGTKPKQGFGTACPSYSTTPSDWYQVSSYASDTGTTITGALAKHFDTSSSSSNSIGGSFTPGVDTSNVYVCTQTSSTSDPPLPGDSVTVVVYYPFKPAGSLLGSATMPLTAQSQWVVE